MNQKDRKLLLQDLCARLLYGVEADCVGEYVKIKYIDPHRSTAYISNLGKTKWESIEVITPYLRPMSSMTEEERKEYKHLVAFSGNPDGSANFIDWLNKKMFAYRTIDGKDMFELGLALEAPTRMYK